jgi:hypothetical protein
MDSKILNWGCTPGIGDFMMALNCAHRYAEENKTHITLNLNWKTPENLHHPEDAESILERYNYIKDFYLESNVSVNHIFGGKELSIGISGGKYGWFNPRSDKDTNNWAFKKCTLLPSEKNKVVIWRPIFNAELPRVWKRMISNNNWDLVITHLQELGYNVIELEYKTPIREATYHINTCEFIISYDGMWHYIARNFFKPMIVTSNDDITEYHTRQALPLYGKSFLPNIFNLHTPRFEKKGRIISPYEYMYRKAKTYKNKFWEWHDADR